MAWVRIDDGFFMHPKARAIGIAGRALYMAGLCWSNANLTDGFIPAATLPLVAAVAEVDPEVVTALAAAGMWTEVAGGWQIHDFLEYQTHSDVVRKNRERAAERQRKSRARRGDVTADVTPLLTRDVTGESQAGHNVTRDAQSQSQSQSLTSVNNSSSSATVGTDDEDVPSLLSTPDIEVLERVTEVAAAMAHRRSEGIGTIRNRRSYERATVKQIVTDDTKRIVLALDAYPTAPMDVLVAHLEGERSSIAHYRRPEAM